MHHPCCYRSALSNEKAFCGTCGGPILRCPAFVECGGLVDTDGLCRTCIDVGMILGGANTTTVGGALAMPLQVVNKSKVGRPLFLKSLMSRVSGGDWHEQGANWDRIDAGATMPVPVHVSAFERPGSYQIEVALAVASRWRWREEVFAYTAALDVVVESETEVTVQQNINFEGGEAAGGGTVYAPFRFEGGSKQAAPHIERRPLDLVRAGRLERTLGLRGSEDGLAVPRGVKTRWHGFGDGEAPLAGPISSADGVLSIGRTRTKLQGGDGDVRLLARDARGQLDEQTSLNISRRHLSLWVENDRLMLRPESNLGAFVTGKHVECGLATALRSGDVVSAVTPTMTSSAGFRVAMNAHHETVHTIDFTSN